ncbi:EAL domain protein, partial [Vibrio parahaemolyticus V-223/04]
HCKFSSDRSI